MSASLVGSEMCIRDSGLIAVTTLRQTEERQGRARHARKHAQHQMVGSPVSYTHLTLPTICSV
eukprot:13842950-Alexandrium_andersonii.AAC.1